MESALDPKGTLALSQEVERGSLTTLQEKLVKIDAARSLCRFPTGRGRHTTNPVRRYPPIDQRPTFCCFAATMGPNPEVRPHRPTAEPRLTRVEVRLHSTRSLLPPMCNRQSGPQNQEIALQCADQGWYRLRLLLMLPFPVTGGRYPVPSVKRLDSMRSNPSNGAGFRRRGVR